MLGYKLRRVGVKEVKTKHTKKNPQKNISPKSKAHNKKLEKIDETAVYLIEWMTV